MSNWKSIVVGTTEDGKMKILHGPEVGRDEQRAYLSATPTFDDGPIDPDLLAAADAEIIDIPDEGDIDPF